MIYTTKELIASGEDERSIRIKIKHKELFKLERGLYSTEEQVFKDELFYAKKYPNAVLTLSSAFYLHDLTDEVPDFYYLATPDNALPIHDPKVKQSYQDRTIIPIGVMRMGLRGGVIRVYDQERTLIELYRLRTKMAPELFYEVLSSYRERKEELDLAKTAEYCSHFRNGNHLLAKVKEGLA